MNFWDSFLPSYNKKDTTNTKQEKDTTVETMDLDITEELMHQDEALEEHAIAETTLTTQQQSPDQPHLSVATKTTSTTTAQHGTVGTFNVKRPQKEIQEEPAATIHHGTVKWYNVKKGYGFITLQDEEHDDIFVHQTNICKPGFRKLIQQEPVSLEIVQDESGRWKAKNVHSLSENESSKW